MKVQKILPLADPSLSGGTSFHGLVLTSTPRLLKAHLPPPILDDNDGRDKVNYEWELQLEDGTVFTIYDWKEYRPLKDDEVIRWHIGHNSAQDFDKIWVALMNHGQKL